MEVSISKKLVNAIYSSLHSHKETCERIQALILWYRPVYSLIYLLVIETFFCIIYFLPFSFASNACFIIGTAVVIKCIYSAYPKLFDRLISFEYKSLTNQRRIRSVKEVSAYLCTCLSIGTKLLENAFMAVETSNIFNIGVILFVLFVFFVFTFFVGDFCFMWLVFHLIFVLPGVLLLDPVYNWINDPDHTNSHEGTIQIRTADFEIKEEEKEENHEEEKEEKQKEQ